MARRIRDDDIGKRVVNADGEKIGVISGIREGTAYVDADPGLGDTLRSKLGWGKIDEDDYPLKRSRIERINDEEVRLKEEF
jgi:hypothetical protein